MTVSKEEYQAYEKVRVSGVTNMFALKTVMALSGLSREKVIEVMDNYGELMKLYGQGVEQ